MTIKQIKTNYEEIKSDLYKVLSGKDMSNVLKLKNAFLREMGYEREYIATNARKAEIEAHLLCLCKASRIMLG